MSYMDYYEKKTTHCLIDGKQVRYDACATSVLEHAKEYYKAAFKYIGSGYTYYIDGVENVSKTLHHFFIYK